MRIKTLLIAAAALAVGVISSEAQVYSQNIVGYANVPCNDANYFYMLQCPFNVGVSNGANEIFGTNLPDTSTVQTWSEPNQTYVTAVYDGSQGNGIYWYLSDGLTPGPAPILLPGQGFFLLPVNGTVTNTFAGAVAVPSGGTNIMQLNDANNFYLVGSTIPYSGSVSNVVAGTSQGINLNGLPDTSTVQTWDEPNQSYVTFVYDTSQGNGIFWYQSDGLTPGPSPSVNVGQALFVLPVNGTYNWTQSLP
jgi:hypothetical protein